MDELFKRKGKVSISEELIKENPEAIMKITGKMLITKVERESLIEGSVDSKLIYYGFSPEFDICREDNFPTYDVVVIEDKDNLKIEIY